MGIGHFFKKYRVGALFLVLIGVVLYFAINVYHVLIWPIQLFGGNIIILLIYIIFAPYFVGRFATSQGLRKILERLTARSPRLTRLIKAFPTEIESMTFPGVLVDGVWYGYVTARWKEKDNPDLVFCNVIVPHIPLVFSGGNLGRFPESRLTYTGLPVTRELERYFSYGMNNPDLEPSQMLPLNPKTA